MKKLLFALLIVTVASGISIAVSADEFTDNADMDYSYNSDYDERTEQKEKTSSKYDDIEETYEESYDEYQNYSSAYEPEEDASSDYENKSDSVIDDDKQNTYQQNSNKYSYRAGNGISVYINGREIYFDVKPQIINDRTMVPMRAIFEALGADVGWNESTRTVTGATDDTIIRLTIGQNYLTKNGQTIYLDSPAVIVSDRTLVPARAIAEGLGCTVNWYGDVRVVEILSE